MGTPSEIQWLTLLEIVNGDDELKSGCFLGLNGKARATKKWNNISEELNMLATPLDGGATKSGLQWKEALGYLKSRAKKAYNKKVAYFQGTGGGKPPELVGLGLGASYEKCMRIFGTVTACGNTNVASPLEIQRQREQRRMDSDQRSKDNFYHRSDQRNSQNSYQDSEHKSNDNFYHRSDQRNSQTSHQKSEERSNENVYHRSDQRLYQDSYQRSEQRSNDTSYHKDDHRSNKDDHRSNKDDHRSSKDNFYYRSDQRNNQDSYQTGQQSSRERSPVHSGFSPAPKRSHYGSWAGSPSLSARSPFSRQINSHLDVNISQSCFDGSSPRRSHRNQNSLRENKESPSCRNQSSFGTPRRKLLYSSVVRTDGEKDDDDVVVLPNDDVAGTLKCEDADVKLSKDNVGQTVDRGSSAADTRVSTAVDTLCLSVNTLRECVEELKIAMNRNSEILARNSNALETLSSLG